MRTLNMIGCGRVGKTLGRLWNDTGILQVQDILTTSPATAAAAVAFIGAGRAVSSLAHMRPADLWLIAVPDRHIAPTALALADAGHPAACAFHASGALAADQLTPLASRGWRVASAHCILSFASPEDAVRQFAGTACGIEGDPTTSDELAALFTAIGARSFLLQSKHKMHYHAAAVFATNFLPVLQATAESLWQESGVPADLLPQLRERLLRNAVDNLLALGPAGALTGPAARGDVALVRQQRDTLGQWDPAIGAAYAALSELAARLARDGHVTPSK